MNGSGGLTLSKTATGTLTLQNGSAANSYTGPTTITGGTLSVSVVRPNPVYVPLVNGNFAAPNLGNYSSSYGYGTSSGSPELSAAEIAAGGWTFTNSAGLAGVGSSFGPASNLTTWDTQYGLVQFAGSSLSQTVYLNPGNYNVSFYAAGRSYYGTNLLDVYLIPNTVASPDNLNTGTAGTSELYANLDPPDAGNSTDWTFYSSASANVTTAGYYTLDFLVRRWRYDVSRRCDDRHASDDLAASALAGLGRRAVEHKFDTVLNDNSQTIGGVLLTGSGKVTLGSLSATTSTVGADNTSPAPFTGTISAPAAW